MNCIQNEWSKRSTTWIVLCCCCFFVVAFCQEENQLNLKIRQKIKCNIYLCMCMCINIWKQPNGMNIIKNVRSWEIQNECVILAFQTDRFGAFLVFVFNLTELCFCVFQGSYARLNSTFRLPQTQAQILNKLPFDFSCAFFLSCLVIFYSAISKLMLGWPLSICILSKCARIHSHSIRNTQFLLRCRCAWWQCLSNKHNALVIVLQWCLVEPSVVIQVNVVQYGKVFTCLFIFLWHWSAVLDIPIYRIHPTSIDPTDLFMNNTNYAAKATTKKSSKIS